MDSKHLPTLALAFAVAAAIVAARMGFVPIDLSGLAGADIGTLFLTLIFVALVIERAVEVYVQNRFSTDELSASRRIRLERRHVDQLETALKAEQDRIVAGGDADVRASALAEKNAAIEHVRGELKEANDRLAQAVEDAAPRLEELKTKKSAAAAGIATVLGVAAAVAGVRILGQFLPAADKAALAATDGAAVSQLAVLQFVDVVLTALLLAGGADGIHQILKNFLGKRSEIVGG